MLSDVQLFELNLAQEIDDICKKNDIEYYLAGGSVIGALRHGGFIPWDDDMDIYMTRDNWLKFREAFFQDPPPNRSLESSDINPNYPNMIAKYTSTDTTAIYKNLLSGEFSAGVLVDILILDPLPADEELQQEALETLLVYSEFVNPYYVFLHRFDIESSYNQWLAREQEVGHEQVVRELEKKVTQYSEEEADAYLMRWGGVPHVFAKNMFGTPRYISFEGYELPIPEHSFLYLSQLYGEDWIQIPGHGEEIVHEAVFSINQGSDIFFKDFSPHFNAESYLNNVIKRKQNRIKVGPSYRAIQDYAQEFEARRIAMHIAACHKQESLVDRYKQGRFEELNELFHDFFTVQCSSRFLGNKYYAGVYRYFKPIYSDIGDESLWVGIELLCRQGRLHHPRRVLEARKINKGTLSKELHEQEAVLASLVEAIDCFEQHDYSQANKIIDFALSAKPDWINLIKLKILCLQQFQDAMKEAIADLISRGRSVAPDDGDWDYFEGALVQDENILAALEFYAQAKEQTCNGYSLLRISETENTTTRQVLDDCRILLDSHDYQAAQSVLQEYGAYCDLSLLRACLDILQGSDDWSTHRCLAAISKSTMEAAEQERTLSFFRLIWKEMGMQKEETDLVEELWRACREEIQLSDDTVGHACHSQNPVVLKELGDYKYSQGDYRGAFACYYQALDRLDANTSISRALGNVFREDLLHYYELFNAVVPGSSKENRIYNEWLLRHESLELWLQAIKTLKVVSTDYADDLFEFDFSLFEKINASQNISKTAYVNIMDASEDVVEMDEAAVIAGTDEMDAMDFDEDDGLEDEQTPFEEYTEATSLNGDLIAFCSLLSSLIRARRSGVHEQ